MVASGICHSDEALRVGDAAYPLPAVFGHEGAGIIEKIGSAVKDFAVGDQVVMAYNYCGTCPSCRTGHPSSCNQWTTLNMSGALSGMEVILFLKQMEHQYQASSHKVRSQHIRLYIQIT